METLYKPKLLLPVLEGLDDDCRKLLQDDFDATVAAHREELTREMELGIQPDGCADLGMNQKEIFLACQIVMALGEAKMYARLAHIAGLISMAGHVQDQLA